MNEKPCAVCGVPQAEHSADWRSHNYVAPAPVVDDAEREPLSADGFREVLTRGGTVSEVAAKEAEGGAASIGSGGPSILDRFNQLVGRLEFAVESFGILASNFVKQNTTATPAPAPVDNTAVATVIPTATTEPPPPVVSVPVPEGDTTPVYGLPEVPPSNPE